MNILDKTRLLQTSILSSLMMGLGGVAYAQVDTTPAEVEQIEAEEEDDFAEEKGEIVVTGSRLRRNEFTSASPLQVIDGELARDLGLVDASDLLGQTTVVQGQQITTGLSTSAGNLSANGPGSATASLRGLNPGRTLVLVNGRRLAPAGVRGAPSAPDLNLIPGSLVQRVDVLLDGASSVYGSDAVAGVVNYQLQREFEGIEVDAYATIPELPGNAGHREVFSLKTGVSNDKGFVTFAAEHSRVAGYPESALTGFYSPYSNGCLSYVTQGCKWYNLRSGPLCGFIWCGLCYYSAWLLRLPRR
jgi:iron complex outermembrane receptor protein